MLKVNISSSGGRGPVILKFILTFEDAEDIITDSLLEPIGSIIRESLIIAECEEKQKEHNLR